MSGPGFIFWGLFLVFGAVVGAYVVWMLWVERRPLSVTTKRPGSTTRSGAPPTGETP
jgi:hypothetical protein